MELNPYLKNQKNGNPNNGGNTTWVKMINPSSISTMISKSSHTIIVYFLTPEALISKFKSRRVLAVKRSIKAGT